MEQTQKRRIASGIPYLGFCFIHTSTGKVRIKKEAAKRVIKHSETQFSLGKLSSKELQGNLLGIESELTNTSNHRGCFSKYRSILFKKG